MKGKPCQGDPKEIQYCTNLKQCPPGMSPDTVKNSYLRKFYEDEYFNISINGMTEWTRWSKCSLAINSDCGIGTRIRFRICQYGPGLCPGIRMFDLGQCKRPCPNKYKLGTWSSWTACRNGQCQRTRYCSGSKKFCDRKQRETYDCVRDNNEKSLSCKGLCKCFGQGL